VITAAFVLATPSLCLAEPTPTPPGTYSDEELEALRSIHTLLLGGSVTTWLELEYPPYDPVSTLKSKLEQAGFSVVFDPEKAHDAILAINYAEVPSGTFRILEQGTSVQMTTTLYHPKVGTVLENEYKATPGEAPVEGLYWGTIRQLEENPLYFYQGFILKGWLNNQTDAAAVLAQRLRRIYTDPANEKPDERREKALLRREARFNAIRELGRFKAPRAQGTLWELAELATPEERKVAVDVLGKIGDTSFIPKLSQLAKTDQDPNVQFSLKAAIHNIQERHNSNE